MQASCVEPRLGFMPDCVSWSTEPEGLATVRYQYQGQLDVLALRFSSLASLLEDELPRTLEACLNIVKSLDEAKMEKLSSRGHKMWQGRRKTGNMLLVPASCWA